MHRAWKFILPAAAVVAALACAAPEPEAPVAEAEPAPPAEETRPDPTEVDADHYEAIEENERVRVVRITYGPNEESVMHYHPTHVAVFLSDQKFEFAFPDGTTQILEFEAGQHFVAPAGLHSPKNLLDEEAVVMAIELKDGAPPAAAATGGPDPVEVDAHHYALEHEDERVRILRINYGPGEESVMHYHPEHVAVFLQDQLWGLEDPEGETQEVPGAEGGYIIAPAGQHLPKNLGEDAAEVIVVELK